ncbi:hypothetical protein HUT19_05895 [Streptomyces sp. NA02950]|uniref:hypothetical protein n=1 Tax=Streptomyces sp. NA02950 TaxID=2742137 RepID=UPI00158FBB0D|nr:hypothetical protein [Streptomyces sp. NA02950]QKV91331.1 hypothetical protein HUT19_05895 [Streptomyces sp. NA02950]
MYELSRVRLYSIGPAGARYADTVLDLRGVGEPVPSPAPTQAEFFEAEPVGPPRRPAPAGVLFLENGGGKSVLLKLIFSVMLPGHRNTLGGASSGVLRKFLLADDCGHVALEWQHTVTGETVVVGKVSEWRGRQISNDPRKFAEAWYSFRPGPGLSLDSLPVAESVAVRPIAEGASIARGRRRTMKGFRDALTEAGKAYPHLDVVWVEIHERWNEHLGDLGLDPELFRYQREMNADEGEAAGLFAVKNDSDFTDLLLRAVTDTRDTDGLADLVHGFAHKLGRRAELTAERDFTAGSLDLLSRIAEAADRREQARGVHAGAERRTRTLARRLGARGAEERGRAAELAQQVASAAHAVTEAETARGRSDLVAAELAYRHASLALAAAEKGAAAQRRELNDARTLHSAWQAAETVLRHRAAADRSARVAAAIREAERDAAPALAARAKAAGDLVRALHAAAEDGERVANEEEERSAALQETGECAHRDATAAATAAQRARSDAEHLRQRLTEVEQETAEAVRAGWLDDSAPDADPARAALAASDAEKTATAAWDAARETARRTADHAKTAAAEQARTELAAARAADAARAAESAYEGERRTAEALGAEQRLLELLGLPQPSAPVPAPRGTDRPSAARSGGAAAVTVRIPAAGATPPKGGGRPLPAESGRAGWITVPVDDTDDADDMLGLAQLPAAFRAENRDGPFAPEPGPYAEDDAEDDDEDEADDGAPVLAGPTARGAAQNGGDTRGTFTDAAEHGSAADGSLPTAEPRARTATHAEDGPEAHGDAYQARTPAAADAAGAARTAESGERGNVPLSGRAWAPEPGPDMDGRDGNPAVDGGSHQAAGAPAPGAGAVVREGGVEGEACAPDSAADADGAAGTRSVDGRPAAAQSMPGTDGGGGAPAVDAGGAARTVAADAVPPGRVTVRVEDGDVGEERRRRRAVAAESRPAGRVSADVEGSDAPEASGSAPHADTGNAPADAARTRPGAQHDGATGESIDDPGCWDPELGEDTAQAPRPPRDRPAPAPLRPEGPLTAQELDRNAEALRELLDESVASAERQLFELRTAAADDSRILAALGDGGLLPPSPDVLAAVEFLGEHGIPALPGWRYLAQAVDPADHAAVLAARPELVDGVVITDPDTHARARGVLAQASLLPRSAVAVGTAAALLAPTPAPGERDSGVFLVPPNPAMHDERAADDERRELRARATARDEEIRALAARLEADRALAARLASWRTGCPQGRLTELRAAAEEARQTADAAQRELVEVRTARAEADEAATEAARVRDERQETAQRARRVADALAGLAYRLRRRTAWQARLRELADEAAESEERADACVDRARAADEDRRAAQRAADDARRTARALRAERAEIAGAPDDLGEETEPPTASLPALREAYRAASQVYEKVGVGADLRAEQARAESDESAALAALDRLTNKVRTRAAQLLEGTDGADGPSRQAAAARAESLVQMLETRASAASEQLGRLRGEAERLAPAGDGDAHTELPEELVPADAERAKELLRTATTELAARTDALDTARTVHAELLRSHRAAEDAAGGFDETAALLRDLLRDGPGAADDEGERPEPYTGDLAEARQAAAETRRSLRGCAADLSGAESAVREASDVLVRHANSTRYEQVRTPARQQIRELPAAALPEHAAAWAEAFAPRLRVLTDELEQLERNRDSIVDRLRGLVESCLATLRSAQRLSRLPEGLGEWSGQEFLRIRFDDPDQATLTERLGEVIDEATRSAVKKNSDLRRDGMSLLLRGVQAALQPRGVAVEILKPDAVLRAERVPVGQMGDVFSGGQLLTAAIALYCTMAALRSNDRGRDKHRHAGTLFLDNPIGRANATYLLELQRAVADALGVQLLYTTGLFDTTALAEFPLVIRLRNDADLRAGLKYISVEEHLRPGLPERDPEGEQVHGQITATRMYKRPETAEPADTAHPEE